MHYGRHCEYFLWPKMQHIAGFCIYNLKFFSGSDIPRSSSSTPLQLHPVVLIGCYNWLGTPRCRRMQVRSLKTNMWNTALALWKTSVHVLITKRRRLTSPRADFLVIFWRSSGHVPLHKVSTRQFRLGHHLPLICSCGQDCVLCCGYSHLTIIIIFHYRHCYSGAETIFKRVCQKIEFYHLTRLVDFQPPLWNRADS